jgi:hypothetical protein
MIKDIPSKFALLASDILTLTLQKTLFILVTPSMKTLKLGDMKAEAWLDEIDKPLIIVK